MAFAPWCHYCKHALPLWTEFENSISEDPNVIVGKINCSSDEALCHTLRVRGFPTYLTHYKNQTKEIAISHRKESYENVYHRLSKLYQGILIKNFTGIFMKYPSFVFSMSINNLEARQIAISAVASLLNIKKVKFYFNFTNQIINNKSDSLANNIKTKNEASLEVYLESNYSLLMEEPFDQQHITDFIIEFINPLFGEWSFQTIFPLKRPFVLAIPSMKESGIFSSNISDDEYKSVRSHDIQHFHEAALQTQKEFAWGKIDSLGFNRASNLFKLQKKELPALIIIEMKHSRYSKFTKVDSLEKIIDNLVKFKNQEVEYQTIYINQEGETLIYLEKLFKKIFYILISFIIISITIVTSIFCFINHKQVPKKD